MLAACSLGGAGHFLPLTPFLDAASQRGDRTAVLAPASMALHVEAMGIDLIGGEEPPEELVARIREQLPVVSPEEARELAERELFARLAAGSLLPAARRAFSIWRPDLLLREPCEWASALACPPAVPAAQVAITYAAGEARCLEVAAPVLETQRPGIVDEVRAQPYLTAFPASLDPSPWERTIRYRRPEPAPAPPLPDWWPGRSDPLVYATLGTVTAYLQDAPAIYRSIVDAVAALPVRVLLTTGSHLDPAVIGPLPDNVHTEAWVDQNRVLAEVALVVCHGGSGTVWGALAAGVPVVVVPGFADQAANGRAVAQAGAGMIVDRPPGTDGRRRPAGPKDTTAIREATGSVLADPAYREAAKDLATELAAPPPPSKILAQLAA